jgi:hypothetical protein
VCAKIINSIGLALGILGAILLFFYGPPALNITRKGGEFLNFYSTPSPEIVAQNKKKYDRYQFFSKLGVVLIFLGFVFQLISVWLP